MAISQNQSSLKHSLAVFVPCIFTVGRIVCGFYAAISVFHGMQLIYPTGSLDLGPVGFDNAAKAIALAILFDVLDGKVARMVGSASTFGREFDSLADIVAFGMAPALLCFVWGVVPILAVNRTPSIRVLDAAAWFAACTFLVCGALRLVRFNLDGEQSAATHRHFDGLPIPGAAAVIASIVHFVKRPLDDFGYSVAWLLLIIILGLLMISRLRYVAFVPIPEKLRHWVFLLFFGCLLIWSIWVHFKYVFLIFAFGYLISGPIAHIVLRPRSQAHREPD